MKRIIFLAVVAALARPAYACDWNSPGADPFDGSLVKAVMAYDAPMIDRVRVAYQIRSAKPVDRVLIDRDKIVSKTAAAIYAPEIRNMSWGRHRVCPGVADRSRWESDRVEPAAVYSSGRLTVMVAEVCGNPARVDMIGMTGVRAVSTSSVGYIPEPESFGLAGLALAALIIARRRY